MLTYDSRVAAAFIELVEEQVRAAEKTIGLGMLANFESYKWEAGKIAGLNLALELIDQAAKSVDGYK